MIIEVHNYTDFQIGTANMEIMLLYIVLVFSYCNGQDFNAEKLVARIEALEMQGSHQNTLIQSLQDELKQQKSNSMKNEAEMSMQITLLQQQQQTELEASLNTQITLLQQQAELEASLNTQIRQLEIKLNQSLKQETVLNTKMHQLEKKLGQQVFNMEAKMQSQIEQLLKNPKKSGLNKEPQVHYKLPQYNLNENQVSNPTVKIKNPQSNQMATLTQRNETVTVDTTSSIKVDNIGEDQMSDNKKMPPFNSPDDIFRQNRLLVNPNEPVAFQAVLTGFEHAHMGVHQNIKFDKVLLNLGAGYQPLHGLFIAPKSGLYMFSATILSSKITFTASMYKNGGIIGRMYAHGSTALHSQPSITVLTQLQVADEISIQIGSTDIAIWGNQYTSFAGVLFYEM